MNYLCDMNIIQRAFLSWLWSLLSLHFSLPHVTTTILLFVLFVTIFFLLEQHFEKWDFFYGVPTNLTLLSIDASFKRESYKMAAKEKNEPPLQLDV